MNVASVASGNPCTAEPEVGAAALPAVLRPRALPRKLSAVAATVASSFLLYALFAVQAIGLARCLKPEGRGEYAALISYTRILTYIGLLGVGYAIARCAARHDRNRVGLSRAAVRAGGLTGLATMAVVVVLSWTALPPGKQHLAWLSVVFASTLPWEHVRLNLYAVDQGSGNFARYNAGRLVAAAALPALLCVAWALGGLSVTMAAWLLLPATLVGLRVSPGLERRPPALAAGPPADHAPAARGAALRLVADRQRPVHQTRHAADSWPADSVR